MIDQVIKNLFLRLCLYVQVLFGVVLLMYSYFLLTPLETYKEASMFHLSLEIALYVWTTLDFWQDLMNVMVW